MQILHTADVHLRQPGDERWCALGDVLAIARERRVGAFVISGDLFDRDIDAEQLRPKIRELFSGNGFPILILPGNHDARFLEGMYFGGDAVVLLDPDAPVEIDGVFFRGIPFESIGETQVLERIQSLKRRLPADATTILLYHGDLLDVMFRRSDTGDEAGTGYMPVRLSFFEGMPVQYVLAGHFHTRFDVRPLPGGGYFVYPGSPVSITRREAGRRKVNLFTVGEPPAELPLDTPHYQAETIVLDPLDTTPPVRIVERMLEQAHPAAKLLLTVDGFVSRDTIGMNEMELADAIKRAAGDRCEIDFRVRDIQRVLEDNIFKAFMTRLDEYDADEAQKQRMKELAIRAMIGAGQ
jgi:DNA repair protein SbcD/Mre11